MKREVNAHGEREKPRVQREDTNKHHVTVVIGGKGRLWLQMRGFLAVWKAAITDFRGTRTERGRRRN